MSSASATAQIAAWRLGSSNSAPTTSSPQLAAGEDEQGDLPESDAGVGDGEQHARVAERLGHAQSDDEHGRHRREDREADRALLRVDDAGQPGVADPRPPHQAEDQQPLADAAPGRVLGHQRGALG
jgi:hypothetical protein